MDLNLKILKLFITIMIRYINMIMSWLLLEKQAVHGTDKRIRFVNIVVTVEV